MSVQIKKKFIENDSIDSSKVLFANGEGLRAKRANGTEFKLIEVSAENEVSFGIKPIEVTAAEDRISGIEDALGVTIAQLVDGKVPAAQLPSFVDDVIEVANYAALEAIEAPETGKIYITLDTGKCYRWGGSAWVYITSGAVDSVNGQTGVVVLKGADIGLDTAVAGGSDVAAALEGLETADLDFLKLDGTRPMTGDLSTPSISSVQRIRYSDDFDFNHLQGEIVARTFGNDSHIWLETADGQNYNYGSGISTRSQEGGCSSEIYAYGLSGCTIKAHEANGISLTIDGIGKYFNLTGDGKLITNAELDMSSSKIKGVVAAENADEAVNKGQIDAAVGTMFKKAKFVLSAQNITNQYIELADEAFAESINAFVDRLALNEDDMSISVVSGKTRIGFAGTVAAAGAEALAEGDVISVKYAKKTVV